MSEYLQNFWNPQIGHTVEYQNKQFAISGITGGIQISLTSYNKIVWVQDLKWNPSILDLDDVVRNQFNAQVKDSTIKVRTKSGKVCYFSRPINIIDYETTIRELRAYLAIN